MVFSIKYIILIFSSLVIFQDEFVDADYHYSVKMTKIPEGNKLLLKKYNADSWIAKDYLVFANPVYTFRVIDINRDGVLDFCVGLIKTTRWNQTIPKPTIHIYSHKQGIIYPIWRASKIGRNLVDFEIDSTDNVPGIKILENPGKKFNIALYRWKSFGLVFIKYIHKDMDSSTSFKLLRGVK